jgi:hypothetical protein
MEERWEPPKPTEHSRPRRRRRDDEDEQFRESREVPEVWVMVLVRAGISAFIALPVLFVNLRDQMHYWVVVIVVGLVAIILYSSADSSRQVRRLALLDTLLLVFLVPVAIFNGFIAAETGSLMPAEQSVYGQTYLGMIVGLGLLLLVGYWFFQNDRALVAASILPGWLLIVTLPLVLHDYRNQTVLAILAACYIIGALAIAAGAVVDDPVRRHIPTLFYGATVFAGIVLFNPGFGNLADRAAMVQMLSWTFVLAGLAVLLILTVSALDARRLLAVLSPDPGTAPSTARRTRRRRRQRDIGREDSR